jgi:hypothetical protein
MLFPSELWTEIKSFAGIHDMSNDWSFSHLYTGNWLQFYMEVFQPTIEELQEIRTPEELKGEFFKHRFPIEFWHKVHALNRFHQMNKNPSLLPILKICNVFLELELETNGLNIKDYNMFAIHIPYPRNEKGREVELIHNIHMLIFRCQLKNLFFCYEINKDKEMELILTACF